MFPQKNLARKGLIISSNKSFSPIWCPAITWTNAKEHISIKFSSVWNCRLQNVSHFVQASMC